MGILDDLTAEHRGYTTTAGGSRVTQILDDLDQIPKTKDFPQADYDRLVEMLEAPVTAWGHKQLTVILRQVCAALDVNDRDVNVSNVGQWRAKRWRELER